MTNLDVCRLYSNPEGTEYHYSFKIYRANEAFFVSVRGDTPLDGSNIVGLIDNDLYDPEGVGGDYGDEIKFDILEVIPTDHWMSTVGIAIGEFHKHTVGALRDREAQGAC